MLKSLLIQNYALIQKLEIEFKSGLSIISGETGAGKSIILGALSLILGQRADTSILKDKTKKCIVEGTFDIKGYNLRFFFEENDIDYEYITNIRREININGKSRAFINDTPVNLVLLKDLGIKLIDIHSQHQTLLLGDNLFQLKVIDTFARHFDLLESYKNNFNRFKTLTGNYQELLKKSEQSKADLDYFQFQYDQLAKAKLEENEQEELETELETLNHAEEIKSNLLSAGNLMSAEENSLLKQLNETINLIRKLTPFFPEATELFERLDSSYLDLKDISEELETLNHRIEHDPNRIQEITDRLDLIYGLQQKHRVSTVKELTDLMVELQNRIGEINSYDFQMENLEKELDNQEKLVQELADKISANRKGIIPIIEEKIIALLVQLGIPNGQFVIKHKQTDDFAFNGIDQVVFLFSANKKSELQDLAKVASGGELSRVMLSLKSLITKSVALPTVIFDEIDEGVSGDTADKAGNIMDQMAESMQVINITHLPQIASKGKYHYLVYKEDKDDTTYTYIKLLNKKERLHEIAKLLSGEELTEAALENARELLKY
jgi:DNA repair protein RecN (Recombination protein N)